MRIRPWEAWLINIIVIDYTVLSEWQHVCQAVCLLVCLDVGFFCAYISKPIFARFPPLYLQVDISFCVSVCVHACMTIILSVYYCIPSASVSTFLNVSGAVGLPFCISLSVSAYISLSEPAYPSPSPSHLCLYMSLFLYVSRYSSPPLYLYLSKHSRILHRFPITTPWP